MSQIDQTQVTAMSKVLVALEAEYRTANVQVGGTWSMTSASKDAALTALKLARDLIDTLQPGGWRNVGVLSGEYAFEKWAYQAQLAHDYIANAVGSVASWSMTSVLASALNQTVADVKKGADELESGAFPWAVLIVVALIALAVLRVAG